MDDKVFEDPKNIDTRTYEQRMSDQQKETAERIKIAEEKLPKEEIFLRLQKQKADEETRKRYSELEQYQTDTTFSLKEKLGNKNTAPIKYSTGFPKIDEYLGQLRTGNAYLLAGLKKSGKSSFLLNILNNLLESGIKCGFVNTELSDSEIFNKIASIHFNKTLQECETNPSLKSEWFEKFDNSFYYVGVEEPKDLKVEDRLVFSKAMERLNEMYREGVRVFMVDNLTPYKNSAPMGVPDWRVLSDCIQNLTLFAKEKKVVVIYVIHIMPRTIYNETTAGIKNIIKTDPKKIREESVTVTKKPSSGDVYGGGGGLSQDSGALLLWRPYQMFGNPDHQQIASVIVEAPRFAAGGEVSMEFIGAKGLFKEEMEEEWTEPPTI